jgi:hypothetical protein
LVLTAESLEAAIASGSLNELSAFFKGTTDSDRAALSSTAWKCFQKNKAFAPPHPFYQYNWDHSRGPDVFKTSLNALLVTGDESRLAALDWGRIPESALDLDLLKETQPRGFRAAGNFMLEGSLFHYFLIRKLIKIDLLDKPTADKYIIAMTGNIRGYLPGATKTETLADYLLSNPDILNEDVWRLFEVEGDQENSLAAVDKYSQGIWNSTLLKLSNEGHLDRQRLLKSSLQALGRGFIQFRAGWFARFHEELNPTLEERLLLLNDYAQLLGSPIPTTQGFAVKALLQIGKSKPVPSEILQKFLTPALSAEAKSTVSAALTLLGQTAKHDKNFAEQSCMLAAEALQHSSPDVQADALKHLEKYGDKASVLLKQKVDGYRDVVASTLASRFDAFTGSNSETVKQIERHKPATTARYQKLQNQIDGWPLSVSAKIIPIATVEETIVRASYYLENIDDVAELERLLDAVSRISIAHTKEFDSLTAPIKKRILKVMSHHTWAQELKDLFGGFILSWLDPDPNAVIALKGTHPQSAGAATYEYLRVLMQEILTRVKRGISLPLLCAPTHEGGWLDPLVLEERRNLFKSAGCTAGAHESQLAIGRSSLLSQDSGTPFIPDPEPRVVASLPFVRWSCLAWPDRREELMAFAVKAAVRLIDWMEVPDRAIRGYIEVLCQSGAPLGQKSNELLAIALILKDPECTSLAKDAAIMAIDEGRLDTHALAVDVSKFLHSESSKPKRLASALSEVSRVSELHTDAVIQIIEHSLTGNPCAATKEISSVLELFNELLAVSNTSVSHPETRAYLSAITAGGKTGKLAKNILARV